MSTGTYPGLLFNYLQQIQWFTGEIKQHREINFYTALDMITTLDRDWIGFNQEPDYQYCSLIIIFAANRYHIVRKY